SKAVLSGEGLRVGETLNPSGGSLSGEPSVASGLYRFVSLVERLRAGDGLGLAHSTGGIGSQTACVAVLGGGPG
ncbi:MAG: thiolase family protein, partial [Methanobacteriota archaeon]